MKHNRISTRQLHTAEVAAWLARFCFCQELERFPLIGESISAKSFRMRLLEARIIGNQLTTWYRLRSNKLHGTRHCRFNIEREKHLIRLNCKMFKDIHPAYTSAINSNLLLEIIIYATDLSLCINPFTSPVSCLSISVLYL